MRLGKTRSPSRSKVIAFTSHTASSSLAASVSVLNNSLNLVGSTSESTKLKLFYLQIMHKIDIERREEKMVLPGGREMVKREIWGPQK